MKQIRPHPPVNRGGFGEMLKVAQQQERQMSIASQEGFEVDILTRKAGELFLCVSALIPFNLSPQLQFEQRRDQTVALVEPPID